MKLELETPPYALCLFETVNTLSLDLGMMGDRRGVLEEQIELVKYILWSLEGSTVLLSSILKTKENKENMKNMFGF